MLPPFTQCPIIVNTGVSVIPGYNARPYNFTGGVGKQIQHTLPSYYHLSSGRNNMCKKYCKMKILEKVRNFLS